MRKKFSLSTNGFTLIEVTMSAAVFAIAAMVAVSMATVTSKNLARDQNEVTATEIGSSLLETLLNSYSSDPTLTAGTHIQYYNLQEQVVASGFFTATWVVTENQPIANFMTINLQIQWTTSGFTRSVNLQTYRTNQ